MSHYQAILFDLDGTLLPMDLEVFTQTYFGLLAKRFSPENPKALVSAVWAGSKAMMKNDGAMTNEDRFWSVFHSMMGPEFHHDKAEFDAFYHTDFHRAKAVCGENPNAKAVIDLAHTKADKVILATNPLFPPCAVESRLNWIGLTSGDFDYITTYDNSGFCKPSADYYAGICKAMDLEPSRCLMVGNDLQEDARGAAQIGMSIHVVTDSLIAHDLDVNQWNHSTFTELLQRL